MFTNKNEIAAWEEGLFSGSNGLSKNNPYPVESKLHSFWNDGFKIGKLSKE